MNIIFYFTLKNFHRCSLSFIPCVSLFVLQVYSYYNLNYSVKFIDYKMFVFCKQ